MEAVNHICESKFYLASLELLKEQISKGHPINLQAIGKCMSPIINNGEKIFVQNINPKELRVGDIIIYKNQDKLLAHRIIRRYKSNTRVSFLTKGDMYFRIDQPVYEDQIIGKVIAVKKSETILIIDRPLIKIINYSISLQSLLAIGVYKITSNFRRIIFWGKRPAWIGFCSKIFWRVFFLPSILVKLFSKTKRNPIQIS